MKLVCFCCGCVGFPSEPTVTDELGLWTEAVIVKNCEEGDFTFNKRTVAIVRRERDGKVIAQQEDLTEAETEELLSELRGMLSDGADMRVLRSVLNRRN